jgi:hypothetical protein
MKRLIVLLAALAVGCASLRQANGNLNVIQLITDAQWGLYSACVAQWVPPDGCTFGSDALTLAATIAAKNQPGAQAAVRQSLLDAEAKLPADSRVRPYLDWLIVALATPLP